MFQLVLVFMLVVVLDVGRGVRVFATSVTSYHVVNNVEQVDEDFVKENPSGCLGVFILLQISCFAFLISCSVKV